MVIDNIENDDKYTVYQITNSVNGKRYIGVHKTKDINDSYMGSGKLIKAAILKHGIENFNKETILIFPTKEEMLQAEVQLILDLDPEYNLHEGGKGGWDYVNTQQPNNEFRKLGGHALKGKSRSTHQMQSKEVRARAAETLRRKYRNGELIGSFVGRTHSEKTKKKIGLANSISQKGEKNSNYGKKWIYNEEIRKSISVKKTEIDQYISSGWKIGRKTWL